MNFCYNRSVCQGSVQTLDISFKEGLIYFFIFYKLSNRNNVVTFVVYSVGNYPFSSCSLIADSDPNESTI